MQPKYKIYATLLDSYFNYLNSDVIYERYMGGVRIRLVQKKSFSRSSSKN